MTQALNSPLGPLKILVVDDHALVREGLRQLLQGLAETVTVLDAANCNVAFQLAAGHSDLDLVLLDYHLPDMNGLQALEVFAKRHPELPILVLSGSVDPLVMRKVMDQGAAGFLTKSGRSEELLHAVELVLAGEIYHPLSPRATSQSSRAPKLTHRQEEVLLLLLKGFSNKAISRHLDLSDETVKNHITGILRAFEVSNRTQAVVAARRFGYSSSLV